MPRAAAQLLALATGARGPGLIVALAAVGLLLAACESTVTTHGDSEQPSPSSPDAKLGPAVAEVGRLRFAGKLVEERPAGCRTTRAVLIAAGRPSPARLRLAPGACVVWGNRGDADVDVEIFSGAPRISSRRVQGTLFPAGFSLPAQNVNVMGPFRKLTQAQAIAQVTPDKVFAARGRTPPEKIGYAYATTGATVSVPFEIMPGGARGKLLLGSDEDPAPSPAERGLARDVGRLRRLPRGERAVQLRPANCATTHGVLIVGGRPDPAELSVEPGDCVIWGNAGPRYAEVVTNPDCGLCSTRIYKLGMPPRAVGEAVGPLLRRYAPDGHRIAYVIKPGGARGTIILR